MVRRFPAHGVSLVLAAAIFLLGADASVCRRCANDSQLLGKMKTQIAWNQRLAQELYISYVTHAGLREDAPRLCETTPVSWFPNGDIAKTKAYGAMLQELYGTLKKMEDALALLQERQKQSNPEDPLCRELERASLSVAGLLQNAQCAICLREGLAPTGIAPVWRTQSENLSYQKIEGCRILWSYSKFLKRLAKGFKRQANREERPARRKEAKRARLLA